MFRSLVLHERLGCALPGQHLQGGNDSLNPYSIRFALDTICSFCGIAQSYQLNLTQSEFGLLHFLFLNRFSPLLGFEKQTAKTNQT